MQNDCRNSVLRVVRWSKAGWKFAYIAPRRYLRHLVCCVTSCWILTQQKCYLPQTAFTLFGFSFCQDVLVQHSLPLSIECLSIQVHCRLVCTCDKLSVGCPPLGGGGVWGELFIQPKTLLYRLPPHPPPLESFCERMHRNLSSPVAWSSRLSNRRKRLKYGP